MNSIPLLIPVDPEVPKISLDTIQIGDILEGEISFLKASSTKIKHIIIIEDANHEFGGFIGSCIDKNGQKTYTMRLKKSGDGQQFDLYIDRIGNQNKFGTFFVNEKIEPEPVIGNKFLFDTSNLKDHPISFKDRDLGHVATLEINENPGVLQTIDAGKSLVGVIVQFGLDTYLADDIGDIHCLGRAKNKSKLQGLLSTNNGEVIQNEYIIQRVGHAGIIVSGEAIDSEKIQEFLLTKFVVNLDESVSCIIVSNQDGGRVGEFKFSFPRDSQFSKIEVLFKSLIRFFKR